MKCSAPTAHVSACFAARVIMCNEMILMIIIDVFVSRVVDDILMIVMIMRK